MRTSRTRKPAQPSADQDGPFRPLFVESEEVKARYTFSEDEVHQALVDWLENHHNIKAEYNSTLIAVIPEKNGSGGNTIENLLDKYELAIEVEE